MSITAEELAKLNEECIQLYGDPISGFYAGCNVNVNSGKSRFEPEGTMYSMHDCDSRCTKFIDCPLKMTTPIFTVEEREAKAKLWDEKYRSKNPKK